jgi:beta-N-acetylhexosaminidase
MNLGRLIIDIEGSELSRNDIDILRHPYIGGVILFARNFISINQVASLISSIKDLRSPSLVVYLDHEGGRVQRFKNGLTVLPSIDTLGIKYNDKPHEAIELSNELGWLMGFELSYIGVDVNTMPVLDIDYKRSNVMSGRCFADDPGIVSELSAAFLKGVKTTNMRSICKHYPGHGYAKTDSHLELPDDKRGLKAIFSNDLLPYKQAIELGVEGVMTSHVRYNNIDTLPPTISRKWLQILRNDLRYKGLIFSDDMSMKALDEFGIIEDNLLKAIDAGCDCLFICNDREKVVSILDNVIIKNTEEVVSKIINLNSPNVQKKNLYANKKRISIIEKLKKIDEKKQIEITL